MDLDSAKSPTGASMATRTTRRLALRAGSAVSLSLALFFFVWLGGCGEREDFDREREQVRLYELRYRENKDAYDGFKHMADTYGWKMWAWDGRRSVGVLDLAGSVYEPVYSARPGYVLSGASQRRAQRIALVESRAQTPWRKNPGTGDGSRLVILGPQRPVREVGFSAAFYGPSLAIGRHSVLVGRYNEAYLYDDTTGALKSVFKSEEWIIHKVELVEGKFLAILLHREAICRLVVLSAREPYDELSSANGVSNVSVAGENVIIQKGGACVLYNPLDGASEPLADGDLLFSSGADEFLFCVMGEGNPRFGRGALYRYNISAGQKELLWDSPSVGAGARRSEAGYYDFHELIVSPDGGFLFMTQDHTWRKVIHWREYDVYRLSDGVKVAAFFNPYEDGCLLKFLGWEQSDPKPAQSPGPA